MCPGLFVAPFITERMFVTFQSEPGSVTWKRLATPQNCQLLANITLPPLSTNRCGGGVWNYTQPASDEKGQVVSPGGPKAPDSGGNSITDAPCVINRVAEPHH